MRIIGIDYGQKRIGVALSDCSGTIATPYKVVECKCEKMAINEILRICEDTGADKIIVGLPLNMNGSSGKMAESVKSFCDSLRHTTGLPVEKWDERLSSAQAERVLLEGDVRRSKRKQVIDKIAAQMILQGYLDSQEDSCNRSDS